jgi:predicted phage terminase large subunit-like protein
MNLAYNNYQKFIDDIYIDKELSSRGYRYFIPIAWSIIEPTQSFSSNWHIDAVADHLQAAAEGEIKRLVINIPPGTTKSLSACVLFPAWVWTQNPGKRFIFGSYSEKLAIRDSVRCRDLVESNWYQNRWGNVVKPKLNSWASTSFRNTAGGSRMITTPAGGITGEHAHIQCVDDPIKPFEATGSLAINEVAQEKVDRWWKSTMTTRAVNIDELVRIVMMQRLASNDLAGKMIEQGYELLMLPMRFEEKRRCKTSIGFVDPRNEEGELLDPKRFPDEALKITEKELEPRAVKAQFQQDPAPMEGTIFKREHFKYRFDEFPSLSGATVIQSWDCTFKKTGNSYVSCLVWASFKDKYYLLDRLKKRLTFTETIREIKNMTATWPKALIKLIEEKANGAAIIDSLDQEISGIVPINPKESKKARANAVEPLFDLGKIWLPSDNLCPWILDYEKEMLSFTGEEGEVNDQVDATTQALMYFMRGKNQQIKRALENMKEMARYV